VLDELELCPAIRIANFHDAMQAPGTRHVTRSGETIGSFALRDEADVLYLQTIQLVPAARGGGIGTRLMHQIHGLAADQDKRATRSRGFRSNEGARRLYARLGYVSILRGRNLVGTGTTAVRRVCARNVQSGHTSSA
jgi:GNAT superfamily N-acetyltransferase